MLIFQILFLLIGGPIYFLLIWKYGQAKSDGEEKKARNIKLGISILVIALIALASIFFTKSF